MTKTLTIPVTPEVLAARAEYSQAHQRYADACDAASAEFKRIDAEHTKVLHDCWSRGVRGNAVDRDPAMVELLKTYHDLQAASEPLRGLRRHHELRLMAAVHCELAHHKHRIPIATVKAKGTKWQYYFDGKEARTSAAGTPYTAAVLVLHATVTETQITADWLPYNQYSMKASQAEKTARTHSQHLVERGANLLTMNLSWRTVVIANCHPTTVGV